MMHNVSDGKYKLCTTDSDSASCGLDLGQFIGQSSCIKASSDCEITTLKHTYVLAELLQQGTTLFNTRQVT